MIDPSAVLGKIKAPIAWLWSAVTGKAREDRADRRARFDRRTAQLRDLETLLAQVTEEYSINSTRARERLPAAVAIVNDPALTESVGKYLTATMELEGLSRLTDARRRIGDLIREHETELP